MKSSFTKHSLATQESKDKNRAENLKAKIKERKKERKKENRDDDDLFTTETYRVLQPNCRMLKLWYESYH